MKKKRKKQKKQKEEKTPFSDLPFSSHKESGKFQGESTVVYSLTLPLLSNEAFEESRLFFDKVKEAFLSFLEKESKKKREGVNLGILTYKAEGSELTLFSSYTPFEEKEEKAVAKILFSEKGTMTKIRAVKKK